MAKSYCSFKFSKGHGYIITYWTLEIIPTILKIIFPEYFNLFEGNIISEFINLSCIVIADLLAFFLIIYYKIKQSNKYKDNDSIHSGTIIKKDTKCCELLGLLFVISLLHFISISSYFLFYFITEIIETDGNEILKNYQIDWLIGLDIILRLIFSRCILKEKLDKHIIYSLIIFSIGCILMLSSDVISMIYDNNNINKFIYIAYIIRPLFSSLADVINKYIFKNYYILPHFLMFVRGCFEIIFMLVYFLFLFLVKIQFIIIDKYLLIEILFKCGFIIIMFIKALCLLKVIDKFSAKFVSILIIAESLGGIINQSVDFCKSEKYLYEIINIIIDIISFIIITIGAFLYNEMIILNKFILKEEREEEIEIINLNEPIIPNRESNIYLEENSLN